MENLVYLCALSLYVLGFIANGAAAFESSKDEKQAIRQNATNLLLMAIALVLAAIYLKG
jgi:hypothetical protein